MPQPDSLNASDTSSSGTSSSGTSSSDASSSDTAIFGDTAPNEFDVVTKAMRIGRARVQLDYRFYKDGSLRFVTLSPLTEGIATGPGLVSFINTVKTQTVHQPNPSGSLIYTSALAPADAEQFLAAGFRVRSELALLTKDIDRGAFAGMRALLRRRANTVQSRASGEIRITRVQHERVVEAVDIDRSAFGPGWGMDLHDLMGALNATPSSRLHMATMPSSRAEGGNRDKNRPVMKSALRHDTLRNGRNFTDDTVVGFAITGCAKRRGYLQRIAVHPEAQGLGIGAALVKASIDWAASRDVRRLIVNTQTTNFGALRLYERAGFLKSSFGLFLLEYRLDDPNPSTPPGESG